MGKRRSTLKQSLKKARNEYCMRQKRRLSKKTNLTCPKCSTQSIFIEYRLKHNMPTLVLIGCKHCQIGDMLPLHKTWTVTDLYHFVFDSWRYIAENTPYTPPTFRFEWLSQEAIDYLNSNITLGSITCDNIIEEVSHDKTLE